MLDPDIGAVILIGVAVLLLHASLQKLRSIDGFTQVLRSYRLFPKGTPSLLAIVIPVLESAIAVGLLFPRSRQPAAQSGAVLLALYATGIGINLARGRLTLDCGCAGPGERRPIGKWMVVRNLAIGCALLIASAPWVDRSVGVLDAVTVTAGLTIVALLYAAIDQLVGRVLPRSASLRRSS